MFLCTMPGVLANWLTWVTKTHWTIAYMDKGDMWRWNLFSGRKNTRVPDWPGPERTVREPSWHALSPEDRVRLQHGFRPYKNVPSARTGRTFSTVGGANLEPWTALDTDSHPLCSSADRHTHASTSLSGVSSELFFADLAFMVEEFCF